MPNIDVVGLHEQTSQSAQTIMSTEESAIFEKEKSKILDEITKVSTGRLVASVAQKAFSLNPSNPSESRRGDITRQFYQQST